MPDDIFYIKQNDTSPDFAAVLTDAAGNLAALTGATVQFHMAEEDGTVVVDAVATVVSTVTATVSYAWQVGDTATPGKYYAEFEVTFSNGKVETFPNDRKGTRILIQPELN